jgi:hypothetical protein
LYNISFYSFISHIIGLTVDDYIAYTFCFIHAFNFSIYNVYVKNLSIDRFEFQREKINDERKDIKLIFQLVTNSLFLKGTGKNFHR